MKISPRLILLAALSSFVGVSAVSAAESTGPKANGYTVTVDVRADETGTPLEATVHESNDTTAGKVLEKMALVMAGKTQLPPRTKDGKAVKYTARAPFFFPIEGDEGADADQLPKPKVKEARQPVYPPALREQGVVGGAILEMVIDATGKLTRLTTLRASHPEFEAAATESIKQWSFSPAQKDGQPVESRCRIALVFETEADMADLKWRVAPRPSIGSMIVVRPDQPLDAQGNPSVAPAETPAPAPAK